MLQGNDYEAVRRAENIIRQAIKEEEDDTKKGAAVWSCLWNIEGIKSIKKDITQEGSVIEGVLDGSIILRMRCHSIKELNYLLQYEGQLQMKIQFDELATVIGPMVGDTSITINSGITDETLISLNNEVKSICLHSE